MVTVRQVLVCTMVIFFFALLFPPVERRAWDTVPAQDRGYQFINGIGGYEGIKYTQWVIGLGGVLVLGGLAVAALTVGKTKTK